jgi:ABC-type polysaccharide/polyol phosphate export permease
LVPPLLFLLLLFAIAIALPLAALQAIVRDTDQFMGPAFMVLFYATPILYSLESVPEWLRLTMAFNPLLYFVEPIRQLLLTGQYSPTWQCLVAWISVPLLFTCGLLFFRRLSPSFEDFL